jgi:D-lactate dehydrogenase
MITFFGMSQWNKSYLKSKFPKAIFFNSKLTTSNISKIKNTEVLVVFVFSRLTKSILEKLPKLKFISTMSTGYDHIDLDYCNKKGIIVSNVPFYGENTVAEHAFALMINLSKKIHLAYDKIRKGDFSLEGIRGFDLKDKTLGLVGGGHIGMHMARFAKPFGMKILVYDVCKNTELQEAIGFKYSSLDNLLKKSDVVSLHVPYNKYTHHLINNEKLSLIKKGAILINTARGAIVDNKALYKFAKKGSINVGIDVYEDENLVLGKEIMTLRTAKNVRELVEIERKLIDLPNTLATPHDAFNSEEALRRIEITTISNIKGFLKKKPINKVLNFVCS